MVRRLHQFDLEKDETREREERLNSLLSEGSEQHGALQGEMESLKSQYDRRLRLAEENRRENESSISLLEKDMEDIRSRLLDSDKTNERVRADLENKERELQREKHQNKIREAESNEKCDGLYHDLKTQQKTLEAVTADLESQASLEQARLEKRISDLRDTLSDRESDITELKHQRDTLQLSEANLKEEIIVLTNQLEQTRNDKNSLTVKLREQEVIDEELKLNETNMNNFKSDRDRLKSQLGEKHQELEKCEIQLQRADKRVEQLESELREKSEETDEATVRSEDARKVIQDLRKERDELVGMIGQRSNEHNSKFAQKLEKLRDENRDLQRKMEDIKRETRIEARSSLEVSSNKSVLRDRQKYQEMADDLRVEVQRLKKQLSDKEKMRGDDSSSTSMNKAVERENRELRSELRLLQQESRQFRQRSYSRSSAINSSSRDSMNETSEERRLKAENSLLVNRLRDLTDECRDLQMKRSRNPSQMDSSQLDRAVTERDKLREAINKIANLRKQEMDNQKALREDLDEYKRKADKTVTDNNRLMSENKEHDNQIKTITLERERLLTEKTMLLQERDRILDERHTLLKLAKGGEGATSELCRQLESVINEKQVLQTENAKLRSENESMRKHKQQLLEELDASAFRVGALEAEIAHPFSGGKNEGSSDAVNNQLTASAMLVENLREDISRLSSENKKLKGQFS